METIQNKYIPGVCNIGPEEIKFSPSIYAFLRILWFCIAL